LAQRQFFVARPIVLGATPVAAATAAMPPYPAATASDAATSRRRRRPSRQGTALHCQSADESKSCRSHPRVMPTLSSRESLTTPRKIDSIIPQRALSLAEGSLHSSQRGKHLL